MKDGRRAGGGEDGGGAIRGGGAPGRSTLTGRLAPSVQRRAAADEPALARETDAGAAADHGSSYDDPFGQHLIGAAVQRAADGRGATGSIHAAAARGLEAPATSLPFLDEIQGSFGAAHDVSRISAHVGGAAAEAAGAMGASAYATGDHVAFAGAPDFHTAAHEAAHVVQQRAGVQLAGGVGEADDPYERHADAVADAVVAGRSAAGLLGAGAAGSTGAAVQHKDKKPKKEPKEPPAEAVLPDGVNHRLLGTSGVQIVRSAWFMDGATVEGSKVSNPAKMEALNRELLGIFWWMTEAQIDASRTFYFEGPLGEPFFKAFNATVTFKTFGLPPGTDIVWKKEADDSLSLILSIRVAGLEQPPDLKADFAVTDELEQRVDDQFERTFGVRPMRTMLNYSDLYLAPKRWAWVIPYTKEKVEARVGPEWIKAKNVKTADPTTEDTSAFGGTTFPNYIPLEDRTYYLAWMEAAIGKQTPDGGAGMVQIDDDLIRAMRRLDEDTLLKEKVLDRMRAAQKGGGFVLDARSLRRLIHETTEEQERIRLGLQPAAAPPPAPGAAAPAKPYTSPHDVQVAPKTRFYERPIYGSIVNLGSLASVGKSTDLYFDSEDPQGIGFVGVDISWYATPMGDPTNRVRSGHTFNYAHHKPAKWSVSFDKVGKYEITAFVDHQSYWPSSFKTFIDVRTEDDRLEEVEQHAFGSFDDETKVTEASHFFSVSWTNDRFGPNKYTFGKVREGEIPDDWDARTLDERLGFMKRDRDALNALIKQHEGRDNRASKDLVAYAKHALESMASTETRIRDDGKDLMPFEVRGAFLSQRNGVRSGDLNLVGMAGSRHKRVVTPGDEFSSGSVDEWEQPTVKLHDLSQLYEPKNAVYTGEGDDFRKSAELAFIDLCKSYPEGRVSLVMEQLTATGGKTGKTLGFELHTGTAWKDAKEVVWDSKVQIAVNLVAAAVTIFVPGAALVTMALVTAYNATDTLDNLATLHRKGQATWKDNVEAGLMIGVDLLPFAGELKAVGKLGKGTLFAIDAAQLATNVVVLTDQGLAQVRALRDQYVVEIAHLQAEIDGFRAVNDSDPRIAAKQRQLDERVQEARGAGVKMFTEMAANGAVMMMAPLAFTHMLKGFGKANGADLATSDLFVEGKPGEVPRYDPVTGKIHGDSNLLTPESLAQLQQAWTLDVSAKHADAANILGVRLDQVVIKRDPDATKTTIKQADDGTWEVRTPEKREHAKVLDDIWRERQKLGDAPAQRPAALERGSYEPTFSMDDVIATGKPVIVGHRLESSTAANEVMQALADGDRKALKSLGLPTMPKGFDPRSVEWGLGVLPDGKYVIIRGDHGAVDWGPFPEVRALGHTHPLRAGKHLKKDGGPAGIHILDMVKGGGVNELNRVNFFPSAADVAFCVRNGLATHTVHTPYVHTGKGIVGNPLGDFADMPRVHIEIVGAQRIGAWEGIEHIPAFQAHVVVRDADGKIVWEGDMVSVHHPAAGSLIQFDPPPAHWLKPGAGGGNTSGGATPAPTRAPKNDVEELALADWQALEKSGKNYGGKFDSDIWYDRYNDGLRYDLAKDVWFRPDGGKTRDPQKFDSKKWTKKKVYDHLAGDDSTSTFKKFAEMLIDEGIATRATIEKKIEQLGFLGRDEDVVRHELKVAYHEAILDAMKKPKTPEGKFEAMRRITGRLDSSDKGNLTEDWYKDVILGGKGHTHVSARKDALLEDQQIELEKNRYVDIVDGNIGREVKSGEGALGEADLSQMRDYARMVDGQATLRTPSGDAQIKHVRFSFTSPAGSKANVKTMRMAFTDAELKGRISFEVFTSKGERVVIASEQQLDAQAWLFE